MDALKVIPQVFFDIIARIVPGGITIILTVIYYGSEFWKQTLVAISGNYLDKENVFAFSFASLLFLSFSVGHLISPLAKLVQNCTDALPKQFPKSCKRIEPDSYSYEWLRIHHPDAGSLCAKLRAEFTLYNGLSAVFFIFSALPVFLPPQIGCHRSTCLFLVVLGILMAYRGYDTRGTFAKCIKHFRKAVMDQPK